MSIIQINCWGTSYEAVDAVRTLVKGYLRDHFVSPIEGLNHQGDADLYDEVRELRQLVTRYRVWWIS